jgi:hypothetical protein
VCLKNSVCICVEKIYKMGCLDGSGVPVLYTWSAGTNGKRWLDAVQTRACTGIKNAHNSVTVENRTHV